LQCCQELNYVMGGTLLYHNKYETALDASSSQLFVCRVVATQLSSDVTKRIVLTDPYRIKCPAEVPTVNFDLPLGVQLLQVYISSKEYFKLHDEATRSRNMFQYLSSKSIKKVCLVTGLCQFKMFDCQLQSKPMSSKEPVISAMKRDQSIIFTAVPEEDSEHQLIIKTEKTSASQNRPKFLNLKSKTTDVEKKPVSSTQFYGQTSVCSTPMTDLSKVIHSKPLSICINANENPKVEDDEEKSSETVNHPYDFDSVLARVPYLKVTSNLYDSKRFSSVFDVREKMKSVSRGVTMKYYNSELQHEYNMCNETTPNEIRVFRTISDPNYPIFRADGTVVSHPFYQDYLTNQMELITTEIKDEKPAKASFDDFDSTLSDFVKSIAAVKKVPDNAVENIEISALPRPRPTREHRKSLTLPLKSLSVDGAEAPTSPVRRHSSGVLLTPLMSKLSSFTFDERSSGFCSRDQTPIFTPTQQPSFPFVFKRPKNRFVQEGNDSALRRCVLFVCGQQDMVVTLLLQDEACASFELLTKLVRVCGKDEFVIVF
jgi:hypothetical protein